MKKRVIIVFCLIALIFLGSCQKKENDKVLMQKSVSEIVEMIEKDQTFVFYIGQTTCASCKEFRPIAEQFVKSNDVELVYLEMDTEDETEFDEFKEKYTPKLLYTPTAFVVIDGEITEYRVVSKTSYRKLKEWLTEAGIVND